MFRFLFGFIIFALFGAGGWFGYVKDVEGESAPFGINWDWT